MYEKRHFDSLPVYSPSNQFSHPFDYGVPEEDYVYGIQPPAPGSYYIEDEPQYFYKWTSPPGIIRILECIILVLCVGIFACVASTLAWDYNYGYGYGYGGGGGGGLGGYYPSYGYGSSYGSGYGYDNYNRGTNPAAAKGFMIAMAAICFFVALGVFVSSVTKSEGSRTRKFYLIVLIVSGILAGLELIGTIVYIMGVNPMAQSSGSMYYNQVRMLCNQFYSPMTSGAFVNQYLYHYCVVDPQEAVAIVCGFLVALAFIIVCVFAQKTRQKIWKYGKQNIYWEKPMGVVTKGPDVEQWVNNVENAENTPDEIATMEYSEKPHNALNVITNAGNYEPKGNGFYSYDYDNYNKSSSSYPAVKHPEQTLSSSTSGEAQKEPQGKPAGRRRRRRRRNPELDESQYETDYTTGIDSGNELDKEEWMRLYPPITSDSVRQEYKREFDTDLKHYKKLCAEMDDVSDQMNQLNKQLDSLSVDSPQYQGIAEEYNRLKDLKRTLNYQDKKIQCKQLRNKLFHIKRMVSNYDKQKV
ncbi:occludin-like [Latimeria chalumnae]|uniref:occludin-like n=1 Tax=Latimeria chalumnae TaxID=7897 RepID=UPI0006D8E017|nr:PREDICTED: occludin-like [Latimeria chalumnae]|eukprot:XP_014347290.1 PREDICTED: occludin-like [Latimeria chalumnae]